MKKVKINEIEKRTSNEYFSNVLVVTITAFLKCKDIIVAFSKKERTIVTNNFVTTAREKDKISNSKTDVVSFAFLWVYRSK